MSKYQWVKMFSVPGGHKYFRDQHSLNIALADDSGPTPDCTDDGVLWLDFLRCVSIATDNNHNTYITIPVLHEPRDGGPVKKSATPASAKEVIEVCARFGMKLAIEGERFMMVKVE